MNEMRNYFKGLFSVSITDEDILNIDIDLLHKVFDFVYTCLNMGVSDEFYYIDMLEECKKFSGDIYVMLVGLRFLDPNFDVLNSSYFLDKDIHKQLVEDKFGIYNGTILSLERYMFENIEIKKNNRN